MGNRNIDLHRLARDPALLVCGHCIQRAHVMQAVGEFDENYAHIARHRQQHLAEVLGLLLDLGLEFDLVEFG